MENQVNVYTHRALVAKSFCQGLHHEIDNPTVKVPKKKNQKVFSCPTNDHTHILSLGCSVNLLQKMDEGMLVKRGQGKKGRAHTFEAKGMGVREYREENGSSFSC